MDPERPFTIDSGVLALLRCPRTHQALRIGNRGGRPVLLTDDGAGTYEIRQSIPVLMLPAPAAPSNPNTKDSPPWPKASI